MTPTAAAGLPALRNARVRQLEQKSAGGLFPLSPASELRKGSAKTSEKLRRLSAEARASKLNFSLSLLFLFLAASSVANGPLSCLALPRLPTLARPKTMQKKFAPLRGEILIFRQTRFPPLALSLFICSPGPTWDIASRAQFSPKDQAPTSGCA